MPTTVYALQQQRYDSAAAWTAANIVLLAGEMGVESDTRKFKFGDGATSWNSLPYATAASSLNPVVATMVF